MQRTRIVLAEDHALVRDGTRQILDGQPDLQVVGEAGDGVTALALIGRLQPDLAVLDIRMPGLNAVEITRRLREAAPQTRVLILTAYDDDDFVAAAIEAGAQGYLLKTVRATELVHAVRSICAGEIVLHPAIAAKMAQLLLRRGQAPGDVADREILTPRELAVLCLTAEGLRNREIALRLGVSSRTVEGHLSNILGKLGVTSRTAAVMHATAHRWLERLDPGDPGRVGGT